MYGLPNVTQVKQEVVNRDVSAEIVHRACKYISLRSPLISRISFEVTDYGTYLPVRRRVAPSSPESFVAVANAAKMCDK